jgi:type IV secretory pathway TraG/TraD family ATPase VirD4
MSVAVALALLGIIGGLLWEGRGEGRRRDASFASRSDLGALQLKRGESDRVVLGRLATARWRATSKELAAPQGDSVLVLGPTQTGKTSSLVIPAILAWDGPVLAASVKDDLVRESAASRRHFGPVGILDPGREPGPLVRSFDPVALSSSWREARSVSAALCEAGASDLPGTDALFWGQLAAKLLGPLLLAGSLAGGGLESVARWIDGRMHGEPLSVLVAAHEEEALQWLEASFDRDERQLASVMATLEAILAPLLRGAGQGAPFHPGRLFEQRETLYLCAPAHEQRRYRPLFTAVTQLVVEEAFVRARGQGGSLHDRLLVVLDEAAAIAPLAELDVLAATCSSHGITLLTCFQDLAQIRARYGERASTVVNNHRTRALLSGLADPGASELLGTLTGSARTASAKKRGRDRPEASERRTLIEAHELRQMPPYTAVVVSGRLRPARVALRPWWRQKRLRDQVLGTTAHYAARDARSA